MKAGIVLKIPTNNLTETNESHRAFEMRQSAAEKSGCLKRFIAWRSGCSLMSGNGARDGSVQRRLYVLAVSGS